MHFEWLEANMHVPGNITIIIIILMSKHQRSNFGLQSKKIGIRLKDNLKGRIISQKI